MTLGFLLFLGAILLPLAYVRLITREDDFKVLAWTVLPLTAWSFPAILAARRNFTAWSAFSELRTKTREFMNQYIDENIKVEKFEEEGKKLLAQMQSDRRAHASVAQWVYRLLWKTNNPVAGFYVEQFNMGEKLT